MKLHLGCGTKYLPGYLNIDCVTKKQYIPGGVFERNALFMPEGEFRGKLQWLEFRVDKIARLEDLEFPNESIDEIKCSHTLEHLAFRVAIKGLEKFYSILKPGGLLDLEVPNDESLFEQFKAADIKKRKRLYEQIFCNQASGEEFHLSGWDSLILSEILVNIGYKVFSLVATNNQQPVIQVKAKK